MFVFGGRCLNILTVGLNTDDSSDSDIKLNHESNTKLVSIPFMSRLGRGGRRRGDEETMKRRKRRYWSGEVSVERKPYV